jgi:hypothetical protein
MPDLSTLFAGAVAVLAALAVLALLVFVIVWTVLGIRRLIIEHRDRTAVYVRPSRFDPSTRYWPEHSAVQVVESIVPPPAP